MRAVINPSAAKGAVSAPGSKSMAHRLLISAALSEQKSVIRGVTPSDDVLATADCLKALGASIIVNDDVWTVRGADMRATAPRQLLYCRESGSTLRFMIPIAALSGAKVTLGGTEKLLSRPLSVYEDIFEEREMLLKRIGNIIFVDGPLQSGEYTVRGNVSSQFITGLLFALPLTESKSIIRILPPFESRSYVNLTLSALDAFGIKAKFTDNLTIEIPGNQIYIGCDVTVEGDYSGAAFLEALNLFGSSVKVNGLKEDSMQADKIYKDLYRELLMGAPTIDLSDCPDLAPILFTVAAANNGAKFTSTARLKIKESDRAKVMAQELEKFGANVKIYENSVTVEKATLHTPSEILFGHNDHRIVMALATLCTKFGGTIDGAEAVKKSYPNFFEDIKRLGIEVSLYE